MSIQTIQLFLPHPGQKTILDEKDRFNVVCCGRRWGKSKLAVNLLCEPALEGFPTGYFTPTYKLLKETYKDCISILEPIVQRKSDQEFIELITGGVIDFWSLDNPYAGRSRKYKRSVVDEAAYVRGLWDVWTQSIRPTLTDLIGDAFFFSTPRGKNDFYSMYEKGVKQDEGWKSWRMSTYTNPFIDGKEIDSAKAELPALAFSQEYLAEFSENVSNPFGFQFIQQCTFPISSLPPLCYGIDLAKSSDYTVIIGLDLHGQVCHFDRFQKDWRQTVQTILGLPNVPMRVDSTGVGDPIAEELQRSRSNVSGFKFSSNSKQQLMEGLVMAIQQRKIFFPDGPIKIELEDFEYTYGPHGVRYAAPNNRNDDCVCALALAWDLYKVSAQSGQYSWV